MMVILMALLMSIMNIASAAMYIDLYDKHKDKKLEGGGKCIADKKWKDMKTYMWVILGTGIAGILFILFMMMGGNKGNK